MVSGSESDGEPEVISFSHGKKNYQDEYKLQKQAVDHKKNVLKEKRKKKHKQLMDQKESKLQRLDSNRLPTNMLQKLDSVVPSVSLVRRTRQEYADDNPEREETVKMKIGDKKVRRTKTTQFVISTVEKDGELTNRYQEKGVKFLRGCLFGKRTPRIASKSLVKNWKKQVVGGHRVSKKLK